MTVDLDGCLRRVSEERDESAFEEIYAQVAPIIKKYMMSKGADAVTAEELAQEALARVWNRAASYDPSKGTPFTWVFGIARNLRIDRLRKERVWRFTQELPESYKEQASPDPSAEQIVGERERTARVRHAVTTLPQDQQEVIKLSFLNGLSHSEISARLAIPIGTVKSRIRAAYQNLRPLLKDHR